MRMYDLIEKKKRGETLAREEISYMVNGFVTGEVPDYQMAAMLMAVYFNGMNDQETAYFTLDMAHSGDMVDLSQIQGIKVDKHSTGGVGDKTTLIAGPIVASLGVKVAKMSGRGLGHTGGTIDKLEAIPGFQTAIEKDDFFHIVNKVGIAVIGQSGNIVPADKKIYALRDVTATVDSIPLIASSIMSKKLAAGSDGIVLDVKTGSGAFMKTLQDSITLAEKMVAIGTSAGRRCTAIITDMDIPLGAEIGNASEVMEAIETLKGKGPEDLTKVCLYLAADMLEVAEKGQWDSCYEMAKKSLQDGSAFNTFIKMVEAQGGDSSVLIHGGLKKAPYDYEVKAENEGYISYMDTEGCGIASVLLKAGRSQKEDVIDYSAGITIIKKYGDFVKRGDTLAVLHASDEALFSDAKNRLLKSYVIDSEKPAHKNLIYARVTSGGVKELNGT